MSTERTSQLTVADQPELPPELDHVTVENDGAPDECAIFPYEATDEELATNWIVALGDGFVDLDSMR